MENQRDDLVVIFAGYKDRMDTFFQSNPGLSSRVANHIDFPDYSLDELQSIAEAHARQTQLRVLTRCERKAFAEYLTLRMQQPQFSNARSVRNAIDRARMRQATRLFERGGTIDAAALKGIDEDDIRQSRVFAEPGRVEARAVSRPPGGEDRCRLTITCRRRLARRARRGTRAVARFAEPRPASPPS